MYQLMHGHDVTYEQTGTYLKENNCYEDLLSRMRLYDYLYSSRKIIFIDKNGQYDTKGTVGAYKLEHYFIMYSC